MKRQHGADREALTTKQQKVDFRAGHGAGEMISGQDLKKCTARFITVEVLTEFHFITL